MNEVFVASDTEFFATLIRRYHQVTNTTEPSILILNGLKSWKYQKTHQVAIRSQKNGCSKPENFQMNHVNSGAPTTVATCEGMEHRNEAGPAALSAARRSSDPLRSDEVKVGTAYR